jgi:hypothetical protein
VVEISSITIKNNRKMKKSIKKLEAKVLKNTTTVKGGGNGNSKYWLEMGGGGSTAPGPNPNAK